MSKLRALFVVAICFFSANSTAEDFANCIINKMQGIQNDAAAYAVFNLCKESNGSGFEGVKQGAGRGLFSFESGNECIVKKAGGIRSTTAAMLIGTACRRLYDEPPSFPAAPETESKNARSKEKPDKRLDIKTCWKSVSKDASSYPMMIDRSTTIAGTVCREDNGRAVYVYQNILDIQDENIKNDALEDFRRKATNSLCTDPNLLKLLKLFDMGYDFYNKNQSYLGGYTIRIEDCDSRSTWKKSNDLEKVVNSAIITYPFLDHQSPNANRQAIDAVIARRDIYLGKGYALPDALTKAVNEIGPMYAAKQNEVGQSKKSTRQEKAPQTWVEMKEIRARGCNPSGVMTDEEMARCR